MSAEEYAVGQVGAAAVSCPVDDVVGFAPGWGPVTARKQTSTVAGGQSNALLFRVKPLFPPDVER